MPIICQTLIKLGIYHKQNDEYIKGLFALENTHIKRKIKSGNSKSPNPQTYWLMDNEASELVGFRNVCYLPLQLQLTLSIK